MNAGLLVLSRRILWLDFQVCVVIFLAGRTGGRSMNFHWARTDRFLLVFLTIVVVMVGVLTILVMHQQHDQGTVAGQVRLSTARPVPAASGAADVEIMAGVNAATPANPTMAPTPITPARAAPRIGTPPALAPSAQAPLRRITVLHRRGHSVPAPLPAAAAHSVTPAPQTDPGTLTRSVTPAKPGSPDGW
jgi:hypothetical protein